MADGDFFEGLEGVEMRDLCGALAREIEACKAAALAALKEGGRAAIPLRWFEAHVGRLQILDRLAAHLDQAEAGERRA